MSESYYEIWNDENSPRGGYTVKKFTPDGYPPHSVLAGQVLIQYEAHFDSIEEAQSAYPDANFGSKWTSAQNTFDHLSDDGDDW